MTISAFGRALRQGTSGRANGTVLAHWTGHYVTINRSSFDEYHPLRSPAVPSARHLCVTPESKAVHR